MSNYVYLTGSLNYNFTFISPRRFTVEDYIIVSLNVYNKGNPCNVTDMDGICYLSPYISKRCTLPDHSILYVNFNVNLLCNNDSTQYINDVYDTEINYELNEFKGHRYHLSNAPDYFIGTESWKSTSKSSGWYIQCLPSDGKLIFER